MTEATSTITASLTTDEIQVQQALGILPFKEYLKLNGISFFNSWWYFPLINKEDASSIYFPVADNYIDDLHYSMAWRNWTEKQFAIELIRQCYSCMSMPITGAYSIPEIFNNE